MSPAALQLEEARVHAARALEELLLANHHQLDEVCRALAASSPSAQLRAGHRRRLRAWLAQLGAVTSELSAARKSVETALQKGSQKRC